MVSQCGCTKFKVLLSILRADIMSDSNIECVIEYNKTSKQDMISKKKEKRKANRTISNIEFA